MIRLTGGDLTDFTERFEAVASFCTTEELAKVVWEYGNAQWSKGYNQGVDDPDFEGDV